jgi:hypothetical protein
VGFQKKPLRSRFEKIDFLPQAKTRGSLSNFLFVCSPIVSQTAPYGPVGMEEWSLATYPPTDRRNGGMVLSHLPPTDRRNGGMVLSHLPPLRIVGMEEWSVTPFLRTVGMEEWSLATYPPTDRRNGGMVGYSVSKNRRNGGMVLSHLPPYGS